MGRVGRANVGYLTYNAQAVANAKINVLDTIL